MKATETNLAPGAIGPYSQAIVVDGWVYSSGQIGMIPATGALVAGGVEAECHQVLANLRHVLEASGASLSSVVRTTVYLKSMKDFTAVNRLYAEVFSQKPFPARGCVAVAELPKGALIEIDAVARVG